ncbi:MAG: OB-fold nucleic acid binding domain-containing protein [Nitrososphaerales archaeon]
MKISELKDGMRKVNVEGIILEIPEPRTVTLRSGQKARVVDCILQDASGTVKLSLWDDDISKVQLGSRVRIENGYTNSFRGELKLNVGKYGRLINLE